MPLRREIPKIKTQKYRKEWKMIHHARTNPKKTGLFILMSSSHILEKRDSKTSHIDKRVSF